VRVVSAVLLAASTLVWMPGSPVGAWSSDDRAVAVFGQGTFSALDKGYSVAVDSSGNVYTTGYFNGTVDFDPGAGTANLTSNGGSDAFVLKLDSSGNYVWAKSFGSTNTDRGNSVAVDSSGNVYTTGYFNDTVDFDPGAGTTNLTASGNDVFVSKLDSSGDYVWAKSFGGSGSDLANSVAVDSSGNVYTTGYFNDTVDFDPGAGTTNLTASGNDVFVSKLDSSGDYVWAKSFGGIRSDSGNSVAVDSSGNVYTTGSFSTYYSNGTVDFDPGAGTANLGTNGSYDVWVSKLDSSGDYVWAKSFGGTAGDRGYSVAIDSSGNVYTAGSFESGRQGGAVDFDPGAGTVELNLDGGTDAFVLKLDSSGNLVTGAGVTVALSGGSTAVSEAGSTDSFTVVLTAQPSSDVVLSVVSADTGEATASPAQLTFTSGNWNTAQTVTVTGVDDNLIDGTQTTTVTVAVVDGSSDDAYDSVADSTV
ncbi:uncharacterized protein METZ01_LOCUS215328, partial [marine metagenome]